MIPAVPKPQGLDRIFSVTSNAYQIRWTVDARRLRSTDREAVSPVFQLSFGREVQFKMVIRPKAISSVRGGMSFKKAKGRGSIELRCLDEVDVSMNPAVAFRVAVCGGAGRADPEPPRGPVRHDFATRSVCGLPPGQEEWNFGKAVDEATQTFVVCLEFLPRGAAAASQGT